MWTVFEHVLWYREKQLFTKSIIYKFDGKKIYLPRLQTLAGFKFMTFRSATMQYVVTLQLWGWKLL